MKYGLRVTKRPLTVIAMRGYLKEWGHNCQENRNRRENSRPIAANKRQRNGTCLVIAESIVAIGMLLQVVIVPGRFIREILYRVETS